MNLNQFNTFIFDLDNTLYKKDSKFFKQIEERMEEFIINNLNTSKLEAKHIRTSYFLKYDTTLNGLIKNHRNINPMEYHEYISDVNMKDLKPNNLLNRLLENINGEKIIFTNGIYSYACRILKQLELDHIFQNIYSLDKMNFISKPNQLSYDNLCSNYNINPNKAIYFDDIEENLIPASNMGITTVLISNNEKIKSNKSNFFITSSIEKFLITHGCT